MLIVFVGPSLRPGDVTAFAKRAADAGVPVELRPPIIRGDLIDLCARTPVTTRVLLLDGEFGQRMSVSVAEIRAYLAEGRHMVGASSMGALRAVECWSLGLTGYGWVVERYLDATTDADADVALLFDPDTFQPVTIPLINVRWLLTGLVADGTLDRTDAATALGAAREVGFRGRFPAALGRAWRRTLTGPAAAALLPRLHEERLDEWDRKRLDALEVLDLMLRSGDVPAATPPTGSLVGRYPTPEVSSHG
jgi:hypothetical protein